MTFKTFERDGKINFVDANNVFVGFDFQTQCCEDYGYLFADTKDAKTGVDQFSGDWLFDPDFCEERPTDVETEWVVFRLVNPQGDEKFLHLYNTHSGYYSHGFSMQADGVQVHGGCL